MLKTNRMSDQVKLRRLDHKRVGRFKDKPFKISEIISVLSKGIF
jgi:hypothetical protein